jgi:hypothetical protein
LISDGYPQDWLDSIGVRHLRLGVTHNDVGNMPRGIGALLAISEGYKGIGFLDADNWYDHDHVEQCCAAANSINDAPADLIVARRRILLPDGTATNFSDPPNHIDTNCYWFLEGAFPVVHHWVTMMPQVASFGDGVFYGVVKANSLTMYYTKTETVNYVGNYELFYRLLGKTPPADAKPSLDIRPFVGWLTSLDSRQQRLASQRSGIDLLAWVRERYSSLHRVGRNEPCPCGSGRKYKHCHGAYLPSAGRGLIG